MVHETYDNIVAILLVGVIFVGAVVLMPALSFSNIQTVDYQQLRNTAINVFDSILLDPGDPINWGSEWKNFSSDNVARFGLARYYDSHFYVLDPDKVQRLKEDNPLGGITPDEAKEKLNLDGYGFNLRIIPPFNVTDKNGAAINEDNSPIDETLLESLICNYEIKVSFLDGRPIPNANVKSLVVYTNQKEVRYNSSIEDIKTNSLGVCSQSIKLDFNPQQLVVILRIDVAEVATLIVSFGKNAVNIVDINIAGNTLVLTRPKETRNADVKLENISIYGRDTLYHLYDGVNQDHFNTGDSPYKSLWNQTFSNLQSFEPTLVIINVVTVPPGEDFDANGNQELVIAGPYQNLLGYSVFKYGEPPRITESTIRLQRSVLISGMTYTAELVFWKDS